MIKIEELYPVAADSQLTDLTTEELTLTGGTGGYGGGGLIGDVNILNGSLNNNKVLSGNFSGNSFKYTKIEDSFNKNYSFGYKKH
jgi:hypothetical protein